MRQSGKHLTGPICPHFRDMKTEAQRGDVPIPRSHSYSVAEPGSVPLLRDTLWPSVQKRRVSCVIHFLCDTLSPKCGKEGSGSAHGAVGAIPKGLQAYFTDEEGGEAGRGGRLLGLTPHPAACLPPKTPRAQPAHSWRLVSRPVRFDITRQKAQTRSNGTGRDCGAIQ